MKKSTLALCVLSAALRYYLATSKFGTLISNRIEIATPLNSYKRLKEGIYLYKHGIDPYTGDSVHEMPLVLLTLLHVIDFAPNIVPVLFTLLDLLTGFVLYLLSKNFLATKLQEQKLEEYKYAANTEDIKLHATDVQTISRWVLLAYLLNPLSIFNCIGLTSTVLSNLLLALTLYFLNKRQLLPCLLTLSIESMRNMYPVVLIAPVLLVFARQSWKFGVFVLSLFTILCVSVAYLNFALTNSWSFLDGTLGFIFFYRDLQPNIGLFWYFFTEMFEHFRTMFLITFQMNATVLYLVPLSLKLRKEPFLLATILISLMAIFRSYPSLGDVSFYLALIPLWRRCWKFMAHNFIVFCFFTVTLCMLPVLWHLWIYAGSANANFYFGTTLAFSTGQIFLVTDLLFAHVKREFCLLNGQKILINGKEAKIILD